MGKQKPKSYFGLQRQAKPWEERREKSKERKRRKKRKKKEKEKKAKPRYVCLEFMDVLDS